VAGECAGEAGSLAVRADAPVSNPPALSDSRDGWPVTADGGSSTRRWGRTGGDDGVAAAGMSLVGGMTGAAAAGAGMGAEAVGDGRP
jgi:hypothetical protein